jgi:hypothetical protein
MVMLHLAGTINPIRRALLAIKALMRPLYPHDHGQSNTNSTSRYVSKGHTMLRKLKNCTRNTGDSNRDVSRAPREVLALSNNTCRSENHWKTTFSNSNSVNGIHRSSTDNSSILRNNQVAHNSRSTIVTYRGKPLTPLLRRIITFHKAILILL